MDRTAAALGQDENGQHRAWARASAEREPTSGDETGLGTASSAHHSLHPASPYLALHLSTGAPSAEGSQYSAPR
jgi:hypothetical protein